MTRLGAVLAGLALLAGCAVTYPGPATSRPTASASATPGATPTPTEASEDAFTASGDVPRVLDQELLGGIVGSISNQATSERAVFAAWPQFDRPRIDAALSSYYLATIRDFESDHRADSGSSELNLGWRVLAASPQLVGLASDGYLVGGTSGQSVWRSFWFAPGSDSVFGTDDLLDHGAALAALTSAAQTRSIRLDQVGPDPLTAAPLVAFSERGDLIVGYDSCRVADCADGLVTLTIPRAQTDALLTDVGRAAQAATITPTSPGTPAGGESPSASSTASPTTASPTTAAPTSAAPGTVDCRKRKCVALTFDDGPGPYTRKLLSHLSAKGVRATFFMLGQQVEMYPRIARAVAKGGHEIGVHTWDHRSMPTLTPAKMDSEINSTVRVIRSDAGFSPKYLRPPYGAMDAQVHAAAKRAGLAMVLWDVDTLDWKTRNTRKTVKAAEKLVHRGSIILLHDIHPTSVRAVPGIIDALRAKGYTFVTVSQLLGRTKPGHKYFAGPTG